MSSESFASPVSPAPHFTVIDPQGNRIRQEVRIFPFRIGRQSSNDLVIRDPRASRSHARLICAGTDYIIEDLNSRHGLFVNSERVHTRALRHGDQVNFGFSDSFTLVFERPGGPAPFADELTSPDVSAVGGTGLSKLRAVLEVGRVLQSSFSVESVLNSLVDAALVVTGAERGFLLIKEDGELRMQSARDRSGGPLRESDLRVPRSLIRKALEERAETLSMQFEPNAGFDPTNTISLLELRSVVCVPLVRIQMGAERSDQPALREGVGVLYMDSRIDGRDMAAGNRELLETLAIEASTILENARLLEEERSRQHIEEELAVARSIQQSLLPSELPESGWFRAAGVSMPSRQVGGDYYDFFPLDDKTWAVIVADVAGKGVSSALVASLLQGAFLAIDSSPESMRRTLDRINRFCNERAEGKKYATLFCALMDSEGNLQYVNAGHCPPVLAPLHEPIQVLGPTSRPVGLLEDSTFDVQTRRLGHGDRLILYSDGITEAQNADGQFFGAARLQSIVQEYSDRPCALLHQAILNSVSAFIGGREQEDDLTLVVVEYRPD